MNRTFRQILCLAMLMLCCVAGAAQSKSTIAPCKVGVQAPAVGFWTWAPGVHVKVYIRMSDFTSTELPYLLTALSNWDAAHDESGSGVRFEYQGNTAEPMLCENCLTMIRGQVFNKRTRHATELRAYSAQANQVITYATIVVDPSLTTPKALTNSIAHELGHNFGLLDCYTCKERSTVMNQFRVMNTANGMEAPTACDLAQVKEAYLELRQHPRISPVALPDDDGEEPVDDDTPIVPRKP
jgi:hypothetical protein